MIPIGNPDLRAWHTSLKEIKCSVWMKGGHWHTYICMNLDNRAWHYVTIVAHLTRIWVGVAAWRKSEHVRAGHVGHVVIPKSYNLCTNTSLMESLSPVQPVRSQVCEVWGHGEHQGHTARSSVLRMEKRLVSWSADWYKFMFGWASIVNFRPSNSLVAAFS